MNRIEPSIGISRRYLHDEVADRMRELINDGELEPRARVNESELTERFGISRTPLREAIKILATEGLLELLPNRGARVASISQTELEEMIEIVAGLEATACHIACRVISDAEIEAIAAKHDAMIEAWKARDFVPYFRLNREIHEAIMERVATPSCAASISGSAAASSAPATPPTRPTSSGRRRSTSTSG